MKNIKDNKKLDKEIERVVRNFPEWKGTSENFIKIACEKVKMLYLNSCEDEDIEDCIITIDDILEFNIEIDATVESEEDLIRILERMEDRTKKEIPTNIKSLQDQFAYVMWRHYIINYHDVFAPGMVFRTNVYTYYHQEVADLFYNGDSEKLLERCLAEGYRAC